MSAKKIQLKFFLIFVLSIMLCLFLSSCSGSSYVKAPDAPFIPVSSINIGVEELKFDMLAGEQLHLTSEVLPENASGG